MYLQSIFYFQWLAAKAYDGGMAIDEMLQLYEVLEDSLCEIKENEEHVSDVIIDELRSNSVPVSHNSSDNSLNSLDADGSFKENITPSSQNHNKDILNSQVHQLCWSSNSYDNIDVFNSVPTKHKPLPLIKHKSQYDPPFYYNKKLAKLNSDQRTCILFEHHLHMLKKYHQLNANVFINGAIETTSNSNRCVLCEPVTEYNDDKDENDISNCIDLESYLPELTYQVKRKTSVENDFDTKLKKNKQLSINTSFNTENSRKRNSTSKISNEEIIKKSKLFSDLKSTPMKLKY